MASSTVSDFCSRYLRCRIRKHGLRCIEIVPAGQVTVSLVVVPKVTMRNLGSALPMTVRVVHYSATMLN